MIRPYNKEDIERMIEIWYDASVDAHSFVPPEFWDAEKKNIREIYAPLAESYMYEVGKVAVAFISLIDDNEVGALFVLPEHHRKGIGKELIEYAVSLKGSLKLSVFQENPKAIAFYKKQGFIITGEQIEENTKHPLYLMSRKQPS